MTANGYGASFRSGIDCCVVSQLCAYTKIIKLYTYKRVNSV